MREKLARGVADGLFDEEAVLEVALMAPLREVFVLKDAARVSSALRADGRLERWLSLASELEVGDRFDLVVEPACGAVRQAGTDEALIAAVRFPEAPRDVRVMPLAAELRRIRDGFHIFATPAI